MAEKGFGRHETSNKPSNVPANISLSTGKTNMNVKIGSIEGGVSVGMKNTLTYHHHVPSGRKSSSDSDSDSSDSDSDYEDYCRKFNIPYNPNMLKAVKQSQVKAESVVIQPGRAPVVINRNPSAMTNRAITTGPSIGSSVAVQPNPHVAKQTNVTPTNYMIPAGSSVSATRLQSPQTKIEKNKLETENQIRNFPNATQQVSEVTLRRLVPFFGNDWRRVMRHLGLSDDNIDEIYMEKKAEGIQEVIFVLLLQWTRQSCPANMTHLIEAFVKADQLIMIKHLKEIAGS